MTKKEYKLSEEAQKEVAFVDGVVDIAKKTAIVAAHAVESTNGNYNKDEVKKFRDNLSKVAEQYEGNAAVLEQTRTALEESRKEVVGYDHTVRRLTARGAQEAERANTLEGKLFQATATVGELTAERDNVLSQYNSEKKAREVSEAEVKTYKHQVSIRDKKLDDTLNDLIVTRGKVDDLTSRANARTSAVQTLLQTYFGVPESTFKGVAEDKKEEHVYKLLEEQIVARAARDKKVEEELNSVLGGSKTERSEANSQKPVNRVKVAVRAGNGK